jgi:hypothetical protein
MFREGVVDPIVPGPQPLPDVPQPWAVAEDVAMLRSVRTTLLPGLAMIDSGGTRRALTRARRLRTKRPFLLRTSVKLQGISRHVGLVFAVSFNGWIVFGSSLSASA